MRWFFQITYIYLWHMITSNIMTFYHRERSVVHPSFLLTRWLSLQLHFLQWGFFFGVVCCHFSQIGFCIGMQCQSLVSPDTGRGEISLNYWWPDSWEGEENSRISLKSVSFHTPLSVLIHRRKWQKMEIFL